MAKAPPIQTYKLLQRRDQTRDVFELTFERDPAIQFRAGQFISIIIPGAGPGGRDLRRAYSIASAPQSANFALSIKLVEGGPGTTYLNSLKVGDSIRGQFPMGDFVMEHPDDAPALFIGTGTGVAPHRAMILSQEKDWNQAKAPVGFLLGVRCEDDIIYPELFGQDKPQSLRHQKHIKIALSRPQNASEWNRRPEAFHGRVTDYLKSMSDWDWQKSHYYLCGSGAMITEVQEWLQSEKGVAKEHIHKEAYFK